MDKNGADSVEFRFIKLPNEIVQKNGLNPASVIVPAWFGFTSILDRMPDNCKILLTGKSQYKLFVNGTPIHFGPLRSGKTVAYYDEIDLAPWLQIGENRILVHVMSYPERPESNAEAGPNYCFGDNDGPALAVIGKLGEKDLSSPENWKIHLDRSIRFNADEVFLQGSMEDIDGFEKNRNPLLGPVSGWVQLSNAVYGERSSIDPFGVRHEKSFQKRPIPLLYRKERSFQNWQERTVCAGEKLEFVLDAGQLTTAYFRIRLMGGEGSRIRLTYAESYFQKDSSGKLYKAVRDDASGFILGVHDSIITDGTDTVFEPFRFRTFRFIQISVQAGCSDLTILPMTYIETAYPLENKKRPFFTDSRKEKLYDTALRTLQLCMHDTYEDCPYYEQLMYVCDTRLEMLFTYKCSGDTRLAAHVIDLFSSSLLESGFIQARFPSRMTQVIPMFSLYYILMLEDYIKETGDTARMEKYLPIAERIVEVFLAKRLSNGMIAPQGYWDYFDWTEAWSEGACTPTAVKNGASALQNIFFVYAVQSLVRILPIYHRESLAAYYESEAAHILKVTKEVCYDTTRGLYREGPDTEEYSQHTQIFAVLAGAEEGEEAKQLMEKVLTDTSLIPCSFMQRFYLFRALEKTDLYDQTEDLWGAWDEFLNLHCTTFPETQFDPRSDCHGWSALPLYEFSGE